MRLVLASNNAKKLAELRALLAGFALELVPQAALGIAEAEEPHHTFIENALAKARHAAAASGAAALADDSGVCVDALGGAPGVNSAHYAGFVQPLPDREATRARQDALNNERLLRELGPYPAPAARRAFFISTLVAVRHAADPQPLVAVGRWPGHILTAARGGGGFGYDPLMAVSGLDRTVAELDAATKNAHSHRARAMRQLQDQLHEVWRL
jgi:XTP/dITP diphosphohydrolase